MNKKTYLLIGFIVLRYLMTNSVFAQDPLEFDGNIILKNNARIEFKNNADQLDGTQIARYSGNAMRFRYSSNSLIFDALSNHPVLLRDMSDTTKIQLHPFGYSYFNGGNIGIGTSVPTQLLHVQGKALFADGSDEAILINPDGTNHHGIVSSDFKLAFIADKTNSVTSDKKIIFGAGGESPGESTFSNYMVIDQGKVGIGITTPQERLHVLGAGYIHNSVGSIKIDAVTTHQQNGYIRSSLLSSRDGDLRWNDETLMWEIGNGTSNDFAGIIHRSHGEIGFFSGKSGSFTTPLTNAGFRSNFQHMTITGNGLVGIGTTVPDSKLTVKGVIHAEEVKIDLTVPGPDYVFNEDYALVSLEETKAFIGENKHLPGIPSSDEMQQNGVNLLEMNMKLLEKVEELTLHLIETSEINLQQQKEIDYLKSRIDE